MASRKFGWHSGTLTCQDAKVKGDLYVQDDIIFSDVSAGALGITGGIDMGDTTNAIGIDMTGGTFSTTGIQIGSSSTQNTISSGQTAIDINTTTSDTSGTQVSMNIKQIGTADTRANQTEVFVSEFETEKESGDWANAIVGRIDYGTTGDAAGGMVAAICAELNYPGKACAGVGGAYYVLDLEMNCPENFTCGTNASYPNAFMNIGFWGNATAMGTWEDNGHFIRTDGFTAAASNVLSANSQTLRCNIEGDSRYLFMSQVENNVGIGVTGTPITLTNGGNPGLTIYATSAAATGTVRSAVINQVQTGASASTVIEALRVNIDSSVQTGDWVNAIVGRIDYTAPGNANGGMAAAICSEISLMAAAQTGGSYFSIDAEMEFPASFTCAANIALPIAFQKFGMWGDATAITSFENGGYLFSLDGFTAGNDKIFATVGDVAAAGTLRINIDGTAYYLMIATGTS